MRLVCGTPHFEKTLALATRKCPWPSSTGMGNAGDMESRPLGRVDIQHASFRPEETSLSKSTWSRSLQGRPISPQRNDEIVNKRDDRYGANHSLARMEWMQSSCRVNNEVFSHKPMYCEEVWWRFSSCHRFERV